MADDSESFLVEEFLDSITAQLDRTQDGLAVKAVNRPMTYAVKEFALNLKVFVEMDTKGNIRFRPAGPNEEGASDVRIDFTTITRPMIQENTVSLNTNRSPSLAEIGLDEQEREQLERVGVRNEEQLRRLRTSTGDSAVSRVSRIPVARLRRALRMGKPVVDRVESLPSGSKPKPQPPGRDRQTQPVPAGVGTKRDAEKQTERSGRSNRPPAPVRLPTAPVVRFAPGDERIRLSGRRLLAPEGTPQVRLADRVLEIVDADEDHLDIFVPPEARSGPLEIELPDGQVLTYQLQFDGDEEEGGASPFISTPGDPWVPKGEEP